MDILLTFQNNSGDLLISDNDLATDGGLQTAVFISLFTDRRSDRQGEQRGYWADGITSDDQEQWGSLLWTLENKPITATLLLQMEQYCNAALEWMKTDGVASSVSTSATRTGSEDIKIDVIITRPQSDPHRYSYLWNSQLGIKELVNGAY